VHAVVLCIKIGTMAEQQRIALGLQE